MVIVVNDGQPFETEIHKRVVGCIEPWECRVIPNCRAAGAAGAWNTGLKLLAEEEFGGFVAFLDDDDEWDADHLEVNLATAVATNANVVISGLRHVFDGEPMKRELVASIEAHDFLVGNPGWQGSNTFVLLELLRAVGGFREGLQSLNDRDLAFRILSDPISQVAFTGRWTATWYNRSKGTLSSRRSPQKLSGLRWFWSIYGPAMTKAQRQHFFGRASKLFGFQRAEIINADGDLPPHRQWHGDLHGYCRDKFQA
tara:strand:- start:4397 stop:5161 length:765 start_codon:yes stop_codon:yes gene_type:complete